MKDGYQHQQKEGPDQGVGRYHAQAQFEEDEETGLVDRHSAPQALVERQSLKEIRRIVYHGGEEIEELYAGFACYSCDNAAVCGDQVVFTP